MKMPTPIAHIMVGSAIGVAFCEDSDRRSLLVWGGLGAIFGGAADLDFAACLMGVSAGVIHRTVTHALLTAVLVGIVLGLCWRPRGGFMCSAAWLSHIFMDYFSQDLVGPSGLTLCWPLSDAFIYSDIHLFLSPVAADRHVSSLPYFLYVMGRETLIAIVLAGMILGANRWGLLAWKSGRRWVTAKFYWRVTGMTDEADKP